MSCSMVEDENRKKALGNGHALEGFGAVGKSKAAPQSAKGAWPDRPGTPGGGPLGRWPRVRAARVSVDRPGLLEFSSVFDDGKLLVGMLAFAGKSFPGRTVFARVGGGHGGAELDISRSWPTNKRESWDGACARLEALVLKE